MINCYRYIFLHVLLLDRMRCNRSPGSIYVVLLWIVSGQTIIVMASVPPEGPTQVLSSAGSVVLTATATFPSTFSTTRLIALNDAIIDNQGSSSFQLSDSGTPTASTIDASSTTSTSTRRLPSGGPMIGGILAGIIVITVIVVICFVRRRPTRPRRRHHSFEAQISLQPVSHPHHRHSRNPFSQDEMPLSGNGSPQQKYHHHHSRHSRYSSDTLELDVARNSAAPQIVATEAGSRFHQSSVPSSNRRRNSGSGSTNLTFSSTLNTNDILGINNKPNHHVIDDKQTSVSSSTLVSSDQVGRCSPRPMLGIELLPLQPSSSSQNHALPEVNRQRLDALIQQKAALLASGNTGDKSVSNQLLFLEQQIQILKRQDVSPLHPEDPPPYEDHHQ